MARFQFSLQRVLDLRRQQSRVAQMALSAALARSDAATRALAAASSRRQKDTADVLAQEQAGLDAAASAQLRHHLQRLQAVERGVRAQALAAAAEVEDCRRQLLEQRQHCRVLEQLRERRWAQFVAERAAAEQRTADDTVAGRRHLDGAQGVQPWPSP